MTNDADMNGQQEAKYAQHAMEFLEDLVGFIGGLASEGERTLVIGGAARLDVALERLLKVIMHHHPSKADNLFDPDRPLGSFSAKITLAHRLGLLDDNTERALQMVRKIRNDFAHATVRVSLLDAAYASRVREIVKCFKNSQNYKSMYLRMLQISPFKSRHSALLVSFLCALVLMAAELEVAALRNRPLQLAYVANLGIPLSRSK